MKAFSGGNFRTQGLFVLANMQGALQQALWQQGLCVHRVMPSTLRALAGAHGSGKGAAKAAARDVATAQWPSMLWPPSTPTKGGAAPSTAGDQADAAVAALGGAALLDAAAACIAAQPDAAAQALYASLPANAAQRADLHAPGVAAAAWREAQHTVAAQVTGTACNAIPRSAQVLLQTQASPSQLAPPFKLNTPPLDHQHSFSHLRGPARAQAVQAALASLLEPGCSTLPPAEQQWLLAAVPRAQPDEYAAAWQRALLHGSTAWQQLPPRTLKGTVKRALVRLQTEAAHNKGYLNNIR